MNRDSILSVYSDARAEYTKQLCVFLVPAYFQFFTDLLQKAKQADPKKALWQFQNYLNEIHDWNMEKVNNEIHTINVNSGCDYLEDLLTAVFIAHTKVLTAIRLSSNNKKVEINIPKVEHFLFKVLCETSKLLWGSTYLFRDGIPGVEKQQNYRNIEQLINEGIVQAVRSLVPVKSILRDFVNSDANSEANSEANDANDDDKDDKEDDDIPVKNDPVKSDPVKIELVKNDLVKNDTVKNDTVKNDLEPINGDLEPVKNDLEPIKDDLEPVKGDLEPVMNELEPVKSEMIKLIKNEPEKDEKPQLIIINDKPNVKFGEYNTEFDSDNPNNSDMIYESDVPDQDETSGIEFDTLNEPEKIEIGEYEVLA